MVCTGVLEKMVAQVQVDDLHDICARNSTLNGLARLSLVSAIGARFRASEHKGRVT